MPLNEKGRRSRRLSSLSQLFYDLFLVSFFSFHHHHHRILVLSSHGKLNTDNHNPHIVRSNKESNKALPVKRATYSQQNRLFTSPVRFNMTPMTDPPSPPEAFLCSATGRLMVHPWQDENTGLHYDRQAVFELMFLGDDIPLKLGPLHPSQLRPNVALEKRIVEWTKIHSKRPQTQIQSTTTKGQLEAETPMDQNPTTANIVGPTARNRLGKGFRSLRLFARPSALLVGKRTARSGN